MPCQVEFGTNRLSVFFREIFGVSWKRAKLSTSPKMISVCEEEEKILRKYIVKYTLLKALKKLNKYRTC